jgi:hypothetical protein
METIEFIGIFVSSKRYMSVQKCYPSHNPSVDTSDTRSPSHRWIKQREKSSPRRRKPANMKEKKWAI